MSISEFIDSRRSELLQRLFSLLSIPSVSSQSEHKHDMLRCAERWRDLLADAGMHASVLPTAGNPVVFSQIEVDVNAPTILVYGHYDVMPVEPLSEWELPPFEPQLLDGYIRARGADDDKGQSFMHYAALLYLIENGLLKHNVKILLEGEEEISSPSLGSFLESHQELLKSDVILVSDTSMLGADKPSITTGLRGLAYLQIDVKSCNRDLHSGIFGGAIANPINVLCSLIGRLQDIESGKILVPGFYDDVDELSAEEKRLIAQIPFDSAEYLEGIGAKELHGESGYSTLERTGVRPTFDVCGIWGGYTGEGAKTVLPAEAHAKISTRLVPHQNHDKIALMIEDYLHNIAPDYVTVSVTSLHGASSYVCPIDMPAYRSAERAYERVFGLRPLPVRRGGSIGVVAMFEDILHTKSILMGFGLESDAIHSPNENFPLEMWEKGIKTIVAFHEEFDK
ncbi:MAG TPA: dipeptidase [Bacteroidales bacterium]|nr:dipeptidase [Bacteroidales bacterium]